MPPRREPEHGPGDRGGRPRRERRRRDEEEITARAGGSRASSSAVTGSMEAPADMADFDQDATDDNMQAWFSSGTGAAQHYHLTSDGGVGQEAPTENENAEATA